MSSKARLTLLFALVLALLPLTAAAEASADAAPEATPAATQDEAEPEVSTAELEALLGITPAQQKGGCNQDDRCAGCETPTTQCNCECNLEAEACENACGGVPLCLYQCEQDYQYCANCCYIGGH